MKITILSRSGSIASTRRLVEAARIRGHRTRVLNPVKVEMYLDGACAKLFYKRQPLSGTDVVIPRIAQSVSTYGLAVLNQFALAGVSLLNSPQAIAQARNKMRGLQLLSSAGIDIPATVMAREAADLRAMVNLVGGVPVLIKLLQAEERHGVMVCETLQSLEAALEAVLGLGHNLIVQQYVRSSGQDIRVLVVGSQAVAAVRRRAAVGKLSKTLIRDARLEKIELTERQRNIAIQAAQLMGLEIAAIDLLDVKDAPKVFEVNSSPALSQMEEATGIDLAAIVIQRAEVLFAQQSRPEQTSPPRKISAGRR